MKIERFLTWIQNKLLNYPDIDYKTVKMFMDKFQYHLSSKEKERWSLSIQMIREFTLKQISIDSFVRESIIDNLDNELNNLKDDSNEIQTKEG